MATAAKKKLALSFLFGLASFGLGKAALNVHDPFAGKPDAVRKVLERDEYRQWASHPISLFIGPPKIMRDKRRIYFGSLSLLTGALAAGFLVSSMVSGREKQAGTEGITQIIYFNLTGPKETQQPLTRRQQLLFPDRVKGFDPNMN